MKKTIAKIIIAIIGLPTPYYAAIFMACWSQTCIQEWHPYIAIQVVCVAALVWAITELSI